MKKYIALFLLTLSISDVMANDLQKIQSLEECLFSITQYHKHESKLMGEIEVGEGTGYMAKIYAKKHGQRSNISNRILFRQAYSRDISKDERVTKRVS